ncbi:unnamed protein product (macronuclear) [Paramecium tetraurelia]|uniref:P-type ATPase A domain-containing protein n=1 Tax=Paramecium tetraurelia TaxID=5888 RepID=A0E3P3_PARTE|nr:uncharacterized protein GSPATT00023083001 [Paramecium tetraurelia]CAK89910.1 unnamed protein product [Paramecium tetraurelia]|eukprot:XP_001457307.1 hypothetical protein (macronuclear) [Paramecium tetraurelia strain d4-2]
MKQPFINHNYRVQFKHPINIQQEGLISEIISCRISLFKTVLFAFLSLITCGLLYLVTRWDLRIFLFFRAKKCVPQSATHFLIIGQGKNIRQFILDKSQTLVKSNFSKDGDLFIEYRLYRYYYTEYAFDPIETKYQTMVQMDIRQQSINRNQQLDTFGYNNTEIPDKGIVKTLIEEVLSPFYIFQFCSVLLWFWASYQRYATVILITSLISIFITLYEQRKSFYRLQQLSKFNIPVQILDEGQVKEIESISLVPGDRLFIKDGMIMPCDAILLNGQVIFNEAMLTGESIPVLKTELPNNKEIYDPLDSGKQFTLFAGTTSMETKGQDVIALVTQTAFNTQKGQLIRSIMFPVQNSFKFYADSMKFVGIMAILAVIGFIITVPNKIDYLLDGSISTWEFINEGLDLITITVPPALPTCLQIGVSIALARLKNSKIFCISPQKVNISGKVTIMCFDKTGTLTEEGLDMYGIRMIENQRFSKIVTSIDANTDVNFIKGMATCHGLSQVKGKLVGDPLELKMFESTNCELIEEKDGRIRIRNNDRINVEIMKRFEFSSKLQRMSVIVKENGQYIAYMKGSPEKLRQLFLDFYALNGFRVLGMAQKSVQQVDLDRNEVESNLNFIGFIIMENKLKPITTKIIKQLKDSHIRSIMCGKIMWIIQNQRVYLGELSEKKYNGKYYVSWKDFEYNQNELNEDTLEPQQQIISNLDEIEKDVDVQQDFEYLNQRSFSKNLVKNKSLLEDPPPVNVQLDNISEIYTDGDFMEEQPWNENENYILAISGGAFMHLNKYGSQATLNNILEKTIVYARMRPEEKANLILQLQKHKSANLVGFCGDGANDCGALKTADAGISLSLAEASIAAPFTSQIQDISCVPILLSQGRAALTTSFCCFKFMALYSMIQFIQVTILYLKQSNLTDNQYLYNDLFTIFPLSMTMGLVQAAQINKYVPGSSLISFTVLGSVIGQTIIQLVFQLGVYLLLLQQSWFIPNEQLNQEDLNDDSMKICFENTTLFVFGNFQYLMIALAYSNGKPFRKPFYTNFYFIGSTIFLFILALVFLMLRVDYIDDIMGFIFQSYDDQNIMPESWTFLLGIIAIINAVFTILYEKMVVPKFVVKKKVHPIQF